MEKEWRGWRSTKGLAGESLRLEPSSPLWGARWIELMFLFNFLRKGICTLLPSRMGSEQSESQGRLVFPLCICVSELTFKHRWTLLLSKGLKEMRKSNSSQRSTRKRWGLVKISSGIIQKPIFWLPKYPYEIDEKYLKSFSLRFPSGTFEMTWEPIPRCFSKRGRMTMNTTTTLSRWLLVNCWPTFKIVNSRSFSCDAKAAVKEPYCM